MTKGAPMTDDLDTLRPEVAQALGFIERNQKYGDGSVCAGDIDVIRAELLRLNRENAELRRAWDDTLLTETGILKVERIDPATVMLPVESRQEPPK